MQKISVVVCAKNEEDRIKDCLNSIQKNNIDEIILVDGNSTDNTSKIANQYECKVILSKSGSLTADRQIGIDNTRNNYVAMIDADHILNKNDIIGPIKTNKGYHVFKILKTNGPSSGSYTGLFVCANLARVQT